MMRGALLALLLAAPPLAGCLGAGVFDGEAAEPLAFEPWRLVDEEADASEPIVVADPAGRLYVSAMPGNTDDRPYGLGTVSRLWRSDDGGATWTRLAPHVGVDGERGAGGGDSAIAVSPVDGAVFVSDLWGGNLETAASRDAGGTWTRAAFASPVPYLDRQWMAADFDGRAYILARMFLPGAAQWVLRSDDGGASWQLVGRAWTYDADTPLGALTSSVVVSPATGALHTLYGCSADGRRLCLVTSTDAGVSWTRTVVAERPGPIGDIFPALAVDAAGMLYAAWVERGDDGRSVWLARSVDGATWDEPVRVVAPAFGTAVLPALVAGDAGRVALAWYGTPHALDPNDVAQARDAAWDVWVAVTEDAWADPVAWTVAKATDAPVHRGSLSTAGAGVSAREAPDWTLGDLLSAAVRADGRLVVAFTVGTEGESPPRAAVAVQTTGPRLLNDRAA